MSYFDTLFRVGNLYTIVKVNVNSLWARVTFKSRN